MHIKRGRGFSLIETGAMLAIVSLIGMVSGPVIVESRSQMRRVSSEANLMQIGQSGAVYGFANKGKLFSYTWRAGETYLMPDGAWRSANSPQEASARQNHSILMRRTGRWSGETRIRNFSTRLPQRRYNHMVLADFMNEPLDAAKYVDPADAKLFAWQKNPLEYLEDENTLPYGQSGMDYTGFDTANWQIAEIMQRWAYTSSYLAVPSSWQPDFPSTQFAPVESTPHLFTESGPSFQLDLHTGRNIREVDFPAQKVWMHEEFDRGQVGEPYFAYDFAQTEKLMFDLSVNSWASGGANSSRVEHLGAGVWKQNYVPLHQFPIPVSGLGEETLLDMRFRWTFRGLRGVDYGMPQPGRGAERFNLD